MLSTQLKKLLASFVSYKYMAHLYHWDVIAPNFNELHDFFSEIYTTADGNTDIVAELIRTLNVRVDTTLQQALEQSSITVLPIGAPTVMLGNLLEANEILFGLITEVYKTAEQDSNFAISNILQDLLSQNRKEAWKLRSFKVGI